MDFKVYPIFASFVILFFAIGAMSLKIWEGARAIIAFEVRSGG